MTHVNAHIYQEMLFFISAIGALKFKHVFPMDGPTKFNIMIKFKTT